MLTRPQIGLGAAVANKFPKGIFFPWASVGEELRCGNPGAPEQRHFSLLGTELSLQQEEREPGRGAHPVPAARRSQLGFVFKNCRHSFGCRIDFGPLSCNEMKAIHPVSRGGGSSGLVRKVAVA